VLTRDLELLKHGALEHGYLPRSVDPEEQAREVFRYFDLQDRAAPFTRCMVCNGELQNAHPEQVAERVPEKVRQWCNAYRECQQCGNVYWKGSHYEKLKMQVNRLLH
ncbi:MAG: Mut7-C RNAse domain-containing protein, partial [Balneolaceae bacterium]|nr:Mut7-C RNAse domain-containing protein [Balneolaceae bacterium]